MPSQVTDRPDPTVTQQSDSMPFVEAQMQTQEGTAGSSSVGVAVVTELQSSSDPHVAETESVEMTPAPEVDACAPATSSPSLVVSPSDIRPFTRAPPRKRKVATRSGSTRILTDTPVKNVIAMTSRKLKKKSGHQRSDDGMAASKPVRKSLHRSTFEKRKCLKNSTSSKRKRAPSIAAADDSNPSCLYCDGRYLESANEFRSWIQCQGICKKW